VRESLESRVTVASDAAPSSMPRPPSNGPAVDIGMPAYRRPQFIGEAIESVLAQTYTNWRLVVSENGPGGGQVEAAVRPYTRDPRIRYVATGGNLGPAANWTRLLQSGDAPYFAVAQDDDKWDPGFLMRRVTFLEQHSSCGFVFSGERKIDQAGREISVERTRSLPVKDVSEVLAEGVYPPREFVQVMYRRQLGGMHTPAMSSVSVMSRRSALEAVGPYFDESYPFVCWDVELYMRMALRFPTGFLAVRDGAQRLHHPSITSELSLDGEHWIRFHRYHGEWFRRELPGLQLPRQYNHLYSRAYVIAALDALERDDRRKCARCLRGALRHSPASLLDPRVAAAGAGLLLGRRGIRLVSRTRAARRRSSAELAYEPANGNKP
jgi:glycosyltransferase involved in cell wall biosynthesis